jgi:primosomal protein N'
MAHPDEKRWVDVIFPHPPLRQLTYEVPDRLREELKLTRWVSEYYLAFWGDVIRTALPPGIHRQTRIVISPRENTTTTEGVLSEMEETIIGHVRDKRKMTLRALEKKTGQHGLRYALRKLEKLGLLETETVLEEAPVQIQSEKWVSLSGEIRPDEIQSLRKRKFVGMCIRMSNSSLPDRSD